MNLLSILNSNQDEVATVIQSAEVAVPALEEPVENDRIQGVVGTDAFAALRERAKRHEERQRTGRQRRSD